MGSVVAAETKMRQLMRAKLRGHDVLIGHVCDIFLLDCMVDERDHGKCLGNCLWRWGSDDLFLLSRTRSYGHQRELSGS